MPVNDEFVGNVMRASADTKVVVIPRYGVYPRSLAQWFIDRQHPAGKCIVSLQQGNNLDKGYFWQKMDKGHYLFIVAGERADDPMLGPVYFQNIVKSLGAIPDGVRCVALPLICEGEITIKDYYSSLDNLDVYTVLCRRRHWWLD